MTDLEYTPFGHAKDVPKRAIALLDDIGNRRGSCVGSGRVPGEAWDSKRAFRGAGRTGADTIAAPSRVLLAASGARAQIGLDPRLWHAVCWAGIAGTGG